MLCVAQIFTGLWLDGRHDPRVGLYALWAPLYPLLHWLLSVSAALRATLPGVLRRPSAAPTWSIPRYADDEDLAAPRPVAIAGAPELGVGTA